MPSQISSSPDGSGRRSRSSASASAGIAPRASCTRKAACGLRHYVRIDYSVEWKSPLQRRTVYDLIWIREALAEERTSLSVGVYGKRGAQCIIQYESDIIEQL